MTDQSGTVYDLGYVPHAGDRLGRSGAVRAIVADGLRRTMGIRRKARRKIFPWLMAGIAFIPALVFIGLAFFVETFTPGFDSPFGSHADYFALAGVPTFVFAALAAPELLVGDRIDGVLAVYSSRPISPRDYVLARLGTLAVLVIAFTLIPQTIMYVGFAALSPDGFVSGLVDNLDQVWPIVATSTAFFAGWGTIAFLISVYTNRMTTARALFLGGLVGSIGLVTELARSAAFPGSRFAALAGFLDHPFTVRDAVFDVGGDTAIRNADFAAWVAVPVLVALVALAIVLPIRRYRRLM